jgi:ABC-2 type transport system ATP-binding protein
MTGFAVETAGLTRSFGPVHAVTDLSVRVPRGSVYAFLGPNGAGKTTTIRMLLGLVRPDRGEIRFFGQPTERANLRPVLQRVGAMVETPSLYPHLTGRENLEVTCGLIGLDRSRIAHALGPVGLTADADRVVRTYSLGMRQRLGFALALLAEPELLILDEPTNGLDPAGIREMRDLIRDLPGANGVTIFLSSHLLAEVEQLATRVGIIGRGRLLFEGSLEELQRRSRGHLRIEVDRPADAATVLRQAGWIVALGDGPWLQVDVVERADVARAAAALVGAGLSLYELRAVRPSLEDLFLDLTSEVNLTSPATGNKAPP